MFNLQPSEKKVSKPLIASTGLRQFMFLASHGLRNPLTAIRWSCGRLEKVEKHSPDATLYLEQIEKNTNRLTRILGAIFLVSHLQDQLQPLKMEALSLPTIIRNSIPDEEDASMVKIEGDESMKVLSDRDVLESLFSCILMGSFVAFNGNPPKTIHVHITQNMEIISIVFATDAPLQFLRIAHPEKFNAWQGGDQIIGGTTGLLLTLARELVIAMGGHLKLEASEDAFTVTLSLTKGMD